MKIECSIDKIKNALTTVSRLTGKNLTLPVLSSVLWSVENNNLILRATNLNIGIEIKIKTKTEESGVFAVKNEILSNFFQNIPNEQNVVFENIGDVLKIKTKTNSTIIKTTPHEDFPTIPKVVGDSFTINSQRFIDGLKSVYYSSSISEIKPEIGSVYIYPQDDTLVYVATDTFRLAEKRIKIKQNLVFDGVLIPYKNITEIIKVFDTLEGDLKITLQKNQISIESDGIYLTSRVVDGIFPDYKQIIPKESKTEIIVLKQDLIQALKISNVFSDKFNQISFCVKTKENIFKIDSKNIDTGENSSYITSTIKGEDVDVFFNYKYVIDCFQSITADSLILKLNGPNKPMIIKQVGDQSFLYLVMPMNR